MDETTTVDLSRNDVHRTQRLVSALSSAGWHALVIPAYGKLERNHQLIQFRTPTTQLRIRFSLFSVGDRGESHRRDERRIQITTTYRSGLGRRGDFKDVVLGHDKRNNVYVGLDPRRLEFGGEKHNASSYVDPIALEYVPRNRIVIRPHASQLFGLEYQAIFRPDRISEYIFNLELIHSGLYVGNGSFSGRMQSRPSASLTVANENASGAELVLGISTVPRGEVKIRKKLLTAYEDGDWKKLADLSPEDLEAIRRKCVEIGDKGEYFVFRSEILRLQRAGKAELAREVRWVSRRKVGKGYDISSYETDGARRLIEVKSTTGSGMTFFMSDNEWRVAARQKGSYVIYRVVKVDTDPRIQRIVRDPISEEGKTLEKIAAGWKVQLK